MPDVINIRSTRVVLITDRHLAYLRARHLQRHSIYKAKWLVPISEVQNLSGKECLVVGCVLLGLSQAAMARNVGA